MEETEDESSRTGSDDDNDIDGVQYGDHLKSDDDDANTDDVYHELVSSCAPRSFVDGSPVHEPSSPQNKQLQMSLTFTDLLTTLYNGGSASLYQNLYTQTISIMQSERKIQINNRQYTLTSESLFEFIRWRLDSVIETIQAQLVWDHSKPMGCLTKDPATKKVRAKPYLGNQAAYDSYLQAVYDYFGMLNQCNNRIEDVWLMMLDLLKLRCHSQYLLFQRAHYQAYIKGVIKSEAFSAVYEEAKKHMLHQEASEKLMANLDKCNLEQKSRFVPMAYRQFLRFQYVKHDLNEDAKRTIAVEREQARMRSLAAKN